MKILRIVDYGYEVGGVEDGVLLTSEILKQRGHEIKIVASDTPFHGKRFSDYEFKSAPKPLVKRFLYKAFNFHAYKALRKILKDFNPDVVLLHTMHESTASVLFLLKKFPTILFVHGPEVYTKTLLPWHLLRSDYKHGQYKVKDLTIRGRVHYIYFRYFCRAFYKLGIRNIDEIVALSNYTKGFLKEEGLQASYIPNGAKLWPYSIRSKHSHRILFSAGRLEDYKGFDDLILAMPKILETNPATILYIAGRGDHARNLASLVESLSLSESVKFLGHLNKPEMHKQYIDCEIFIMPSIWPETFGKVGIEAMSVGRPVIATDVGGVKDWLSDGQNGFLVNPQRPEEIAAKVTSLLNDCELLQKMSLHARTTSSKFSDEQMAINIETIVLNTIRKHRERQPAKTVNQSYEATSQPNVRKRIAISVIAQMAGQIFMGAAGVVVLKIVTNALGLKAYGIYATSFTFVSTFTLLTDLGLNTITAREIAKHPDEASEIISHNIGMRITLCLIAVPVISGLGLILYPTASTTLRFAILIMSCYLFFDAIWSSSITYFTARVRSDLPAMISAGQQALYLVVVVGISLVGLDLYGYLISYVLTTGLGAAVALYLVRRHIKIRPRRDFNKWKKYLGLSFVFGLISIINSIYLRADSIMLSAIAGTTIAGIYGVAYSLINTFTYLSGYIMTSLMPSMATAKDKELQQIVQKAFHIMSILASIMVVTGIAVRQSIIISVSSKSFIAAATPFAILIAATAFSYLYSVFGFASVAINRHSKIVFISAGSLVFNVAINFYLIPTYGLIGAAWATLVSEFSALVAIYALFHHETGISIKLAAVVKPVIASAITYLTYTFVHSAWHPLNPIYDTTLTASEMGVIYFSLLYILGGLPPEIKTFLRKTLRSTRYIGKYIKQEQATVHHA